MQRRHRSPLNAPNAEHPLPDEAVAVSWLFDTSFRKILFASPEYARLSGRSLDELYHNWTAWFRIVHPHDRRRVAEFLRDPGALAGRTVEFRIVLPDGSVRRIRNRALPAVPADGDGATRVMGIADDITERQRLVAEIGRQRAYLEMFLAEVPIGVIVAEAGTGRILLASRRVMQIWRKPALPESCDTLRDEYALFHADGRPCRYDSSPLALSMRWGTTACGQELQFERGDGTRGTLCANSAPVRNPAGDIIAGVLTFEDISERKALQERLFDRQKLETVGVLAAGVAHDFNNILVPVMGYASMARDEAPAGSNIAEMMVQVIRSSERAADLVRQLLAYAGKGEAVVQRVDLSEVVRETAAMLRTGATGHIAMHMDLAAGLPPVEGDPGQIQQIATNLLFNAMESLDCGKGAVSVRTGVTDRTSPARAYVMGAADMAARPYVWLEVRDSGCGMDEAVRSRIFDPFFSTKFTGRGLGLAAVAGIVRMHQGAIALESAPGNGSVFTVLLPAAAVKAEPPARPAHALRAKVRAGAAGAAGRYRRQ